MRVTQKLIPSLHAPSVPPGAPVDTLTMKLKSAALKIETLPSPPLVTRIRSPSKLTANGELKELVIVVMTLPVLAWTTVTEPLLVLGTQMLAPSNTGFLGPEPTF